MTYLPKTKWGKIRLTLLLSVLFYILLAPIFTYWEYKPKEGDILFQSLPFGKLTEAIEGATNSPYSHTGLVIKKGNFWYVREALGTVHDTHLYLWILRGRGNNFAVYRFKEAYQHTIPSLIKQSKLFLGYPYDFFYELGQDKIYCSELIFHAYKDITHQNLGKLVKLGELNWKPYKDFILSIENQVPLDRVMITPKDLSEAKELERVYSTY